VIAGDVRTDAVLRQVERFFGEIPRGPAPAPRMPAGPRRAGCRLVMTDRVELPRLYLAWHSPALFAADDAELDLAADILANGRTSRLYSRLIHERRVAVELAAGQTSREWGGTFQIVASAAPGQVLDDLESAIHDEIARLADAGPSDDEVDRGRTQAESAFVFRVQSLGGFGGKADQLNAYNTYRRAPDGFADDLARYVSATGPSIRDAVARWLNPEHAVALAVVPAGAEGMLTGASPVARERL
jgi:zinc protease